MTMQKIVKVTVVSLVLAAVTFVFATKPSTTNAGEVIEPTVDTSFIRGVHGSTANDVGTILGFSGYEWNIIGYKGEGISYQESVDYLGGTDHLTQAGTLDDDNAVLIQRNVPFGPGHVDNINTWRYRSSPAVEGVSPAPENDDTPLAEGTGVTVADVGVKYYRHLPRNARYGNASDNPDLYYAGSYVSNPNEYGNSTLQRRLVQLAADQEKFPTKQASYIVPRSFSALGHSDALGFAAYNTNRDSVDGITKTFTGTTFSTTLGGDNPAGNVLNQKLWAISEPEGATVNNATVLSFPNTQMTRSPNANNPNQNSTIDATGTARGSQAVNNSNRRIRPALTLDLSDVLFASSYDTNVATTKSSVGVGSFLDVLVDKTQVELTMLDESKTLNVTGVALNGSCALNVAYNSASTGANHYVSAILVDADGNLVRYGKLADTSVNSSGLATLTFGNGGLGGGNIADGTYSLHIFSEEVNGDKYLDFAGPLTNEVAIVIDGGLVVSAGEFGSVQSGHFDVAMVDNRPVLIAILVVGILAIDFLALISIFKKKTARKH